MVEEPTERKTTFKSVYITEITSELHVYCQYVDNGPKLEALMEQVSTYTHSRLIHYGKRFLLARKYFHIIRRA